MMEIYKEKERAIFRYWKGEVRKGWFNTVKVMAEADPITIYRRLAEVGTILAIDLQVAASPSKDAAKAQSNAITKLKQIFDVKGVEEGGLTETEILQLLNQFMEYGETVKKNLPPTPTPVAATSSNTAGTAVADLLTKPMSDSTSSIAAPSTNGPASLQPASASH